MSLKNFILGIAIKTHLVEIAMYFLSFFKSRKLIDDEQLARNILESYSPCPNQKSTVENQILNADCDLQIIIPAYNVERYIEACLDSIINQKPSFSISITVIDDGSTDNTGSILGKYRDDPKVRIITQENRGFSGARNRGLEFIHGKYIMFVDSDDQLLSDSINNLLTIAIENDADIVQGGSIEDYGNKRIIGCHYRKTERINDKGISLMGEPWGKVFRSEIFKNNRFPEGFWFEDTILSILIYSEWTNQWVIDKEVYLYNKSNNKSITNTFQAKKKSVDTYWIMEYLMNAYFDRNIPADDSLRIKLLKQIDLNYRRTENAPKEIKESIFILSRNLFIRFFSEPKKDKYYLLEKALLSNDYGVYCFWCSNIPPWY